MSVRVTLRHQLATMRADAVAREDCDGWAAVALAVCTLLSYTHLGLFHLATCGFALFTIAAASMYGDNCRITRAIDAACRSLALTDDTCDITLEQANRIRAPVERLVLETPY